MAYLAAMDDAELYGALAAEMVRDTVDRFADRPRAAASGQGKILQAVAGSRIGTLYPPVGFVAGRDMLYRLGAAEALDEHGNLTTDDETLFRSYRLAADGDEIPFLVSERVASGQLEMPPIDEMLAAWLAGASYFNLLSTGREPFAPHDDLQEVMQRLVQSGYATRENGRYRWTERMMPALTLYRGDNPALYGALAAEIVRHAVEGWTPHPKPPRTAPPGAAEPLRARAGSRFSGQALGAFERACMLLVQLGVAQPVDKDGNAVKDDKDPYIYAGSFALTVDGNAVAALVTERASSGQLDMPPIGEVIALWLGCADHFGATSTVREPFDADDNTRPLMQQLAQAGYATWRDGQFLWTDKIGHAMQSGGFWDDRNRTFEEVARLQVDAELRNAARSIPDDVRRSVLNGDVHGVRDALLKRWIDDAWGAEGRPADYNRRLASDVNAKRLMAMVMDSARTDKV